MNDQIKQLEKPQCDSAAILRRLFHKTRQNRESKVDLFRFSPTNQKGVRNGNKTQRFTQNRR